MDLDFLRVWFSCGVGIIRITFGFGFYGFVCGSFCWLLFGLGIVLVWGLFGWWRFACVGRIGLVFGGLWLVLRWVCYLWWVGCYLILVCLTVFCLRFSVVWVDLDFDKLDVGLVCYNMVWVGLVSCLGFVYGSILAVLGFGCFDWLGGL